MIEYAKYGRTAFIHANEKINYAADEAVYRLKKRSTKDINKKPKKVHIFRRL